MASLPPPSNLDLHLYLLNHVFLPPRLPKQTDYNPVFEDILLSEVIEALHAFGSRVSRQDSGHVTTVIKMINRLKSVLGDCGNINAKELVKALTELNTPSDLLPIYVREQNAAILMTRRDHVVEIESFELSARNETVITTLGRLQRIFPGPTLAMDLTTFNTPGFRDTLAQTLALMSSQTAPNTRLKVRKAGQEHDEDRDTTHPKMVTDFMMAVLRPQCSEVNALQIQKNTREEVMWFNSRFPWRRSALWLLLRVILQLTFRRLSAQGTDNIYKHFMVYFMAHILHLSCEKVSSENIYLMNAKIARRLRKLDLHDEPAWFNPVQNILQRTSHIIQDKWQEINKSCKRDADTNLLTGLSLDQDIYCKPPGLDKYIEMIKRRGSQQPVVSTDYHPQSGLVRYRPSRIPSVLKFDDPEYQIFNLASFEHWVASNLDAWVDRIQEKKNACPLLADLITRYYNAASSLYSGDPEAVSVMLLTLLELWIACDRLAVVDLHMLDEYDPCIPVHLFQSLLLPSKSQMIRLNRAEQYLTNRQQNSRYCGPVIFQGFGIESCFSVRYFDQSDRHQSLYKDICDDASGKRQQKISELLAKKQEYSRLMDLVNQSDCTHEAVSTKQSFDSGSLIHSKSCTRCDHERQANQLNINVHEWPLPTNELQAKSVVFELSLPPPFGVWRDTTIFFLMVVLKVEYISDVKPRAVYPLAEYQGLRSYLSTKVKGQRIGLLSEIKPHEGTHRRNRLISSSTQNDVCLQSGLQFQYFDHQLNCFVDSFNHTLEVAKSCTYQLPPKSSALQQFLFRPAEDPDGPSPNTAIAIQSAAPDDMTLDEWRALATMPLGVEIQWQNVLLELSTQAIDLKKIETEVFLKQIMNQSGPTQKDTWLRKAHRILMDGDFAKKLLVRVQGVFQRLGENWETIYGLSGLIFLVQRVSSLSDSSEIQELSLECMRDLRQIACNWIAIIRDRVNQTFDDTEKTNFVSKCVHIALVCTETFNIENLDAIFATASDVSVFIQCCLLIHDWKNTCTSESNTPFPILHHRWQLLTYRCYPMLAIKIVNQGDQGLNMAIQKAWTAHYITTVWSKAPSSNGHWLMSHSASQPNKVVHYNILTGALLVNGHPLARLPPDYKRNITYQILFGGSQLPVMPSVEPGMQFSCQAQYMGHTVHLKMEDIPDTDASELFVKVSNENGAWELIPPRLLLGSFLESFVQNFVHWYAVDKGYVEFRPVHTLWQSSNENWRLSEDELSKLWSLGTLDTRLLSTKSQTIKLMSRIFAPVAHELHMNCSWHLPSGILSIDLPFLRMEFTLQPNSSSLQCRQYPGMSIDTNQSLGTLTGLENKLLLINPTTQDRLLLIPEGDVTWAQNENHVKIQVSWKGETKVHVYLVDNKLGRLIDNGGPQSKLFLSYLHALTSFCLPDHLTGMTGTEQALSILRSASLRSFDNLDQEQKEILAKIAALTPQRRYYPQDTKVMQKVYWPNDLPCLSQNSDFYKEVADIFDQDRQMALFHPEMEAIYPSLPFVEKELWTRDRIRASSFCVAGFGAENHTRDFDKKYTALDSQQSSGTGQVYSICKMMYDELPCIRIIAVRDLVEDLWRLFSTLDIVHGPQIQFDISVIRYDAEWILRPNDYLLSHWCSIHRIIHSHRSVVNKFQLMLWLSAMAFSEDSEVFPLEMIAAIFLIPDIGSISLPLRDSFCPRDGCGLDRGTLKTQIHSTHLNHVPESSLKAKKNEDHSIFKGRRRSLIRENRGKAMDRMMRHFETQWPTRSPSVPNFNDHPRCSDYFNTMKATLLVQKEFVSWSNNRELRGYLTNLVTRVKSQTVCTFAMPSYSAQLPANTTRQKRGFVTLDDLLGEVPMCDLKRPQLCKLFTTSQMKNHCELLSNFIVSLELQAKSRFEKVYVAELRSSAISLQELNMEAHFVVDASEMKKEIIGYLRECQLYHERVYAAIMSRIPSYNAFTGFSKSSKPIVDKVLETLACVNQFPRLSPMILLRQLSRYQWSHLPIGWRDWLSSYGRSITDLQRAKRLASLVGKDEDLLRELQNPGHGNWEPINHPESLLLEIENGITIRDVQEEIARKIRDIKPGENAVMQLNMGEGKSSVIVPMVVAALANTPRLVRVLVAKPQSRQMIQVLVSKLGGLLSRRVYYMPISRSLKLGAVEADQILRMCQECMLHGGVLLIQPDHILSLKLMCIESFIVGRSEADQSLLKCLNFFHEYSRDIVDESDENFSVKFEQIYTMGTQSPVEFSPQRWILIQQVLGVLQKYAPSVKEEYPHSIELDTQQSGGVPRIRLLRGDAEEALFDRVATHICNNGIDSLPISRQPKQVQKAVLKYLTKQNLTPDEIAAVENPSEGGFWTESTINPLLLLRGLLAGGVLSFCFSKRWRVNYGPHRSRSPTTKLCVPYRAKDNPSPRSEFSHPDVIIVLTSLHYYYAGLEDDDLVLAFGHLFESDNAAAEYQAWVQNAPALSLSCRQLVGVNLEDRPNCTENIFPALRSSKGAVDYFLSRLVFPREMKAFPHKLSASGWDIGELKKHATVGFSGTNDGKKTLPLNVRQLVQSAQNHTNALVLTHLLQAENSVTFEPEQAKPRTSNAVLLLELVSCLDPPAQVIIDVGAQILELSNLEVAKHWLRTLPRDGPVKAIVFVDDNDEICVLDQKGVELLNNSPYARQMEACHVFLDEAHTRGIDLKLPPAYRAVVTLGPGVTKDKLVQACMRMRKLGKGQSVVFYLPNDIQFKILELNGRQNKSTITVSDVLCWAISETWAELRHSMPIWAVQGKRFERQREMWDRISTDHSLGLSGSQAENFLETECQSLQDRYRPGCAESSDLGSARNETQISQLISDRRAEFDALKFDSSALQEEQERELAPEIEFEREVQRPPMMTPNVHQLHEDLVSFVRTGVLQRPSIAVKSAFHSFFTTTSIASCIDWSSLPTRLLVTADFAKTVLTPVSQPSDLAAFQKPVRWILTSSLPSSSSSLGNIRTATLMIIISPYEARCLLPAIRQSTVVTLHQYAPRQSFAFDSLDKLSLHNIPERTGAIEIPDGLRIELNLFAGQLYLESYSEYQRLCAFLGLASVAAHEELRVDVDGFIRNGQKSSSAFRQSPVKFLRVLMSQVRKDGQGIDKSHIGQILNGVLLSPSDFADPT